MKHVYAMTRTDGATKIGISEAPRHRRRPGQGGGRRQACQRADIGGGLGPRQRKSRKVANTVTEDRSDDAKSLNISDEFQVIASDGKTWLCRDAQGRWHPMPVPHEEPIGTDGPEADLDRELVKQIAMDIGKEVVAYITVMYPEAVAATSSTFRLSVRNCIYNEIIAALDVNDADAIPARLERRKKFRRRWTKAWRDIRKTEGFTS